MLGWKEMNVIFTVKSDSSTVSHSSLWVCVNIDNPATRSLIRKLFLNKQPATLVKNLHDTGTYWNAGNRLTKEESQKMQK